MPALAPIFPCARHAAAETTTSRKRHRALIVQVGARELQPAACCSRGTTWGGSAAATSPSAARTTSQRTDGRLGQPSPSSRLRRDVGWAPARREREETLPNPRRGARPPWAHRKAPAFEIFISFVVSSWCRLFREKLSVGGNAEAGPLPCENGAAVLVVLPRRIGSEAGPRLCVVRRREPPPAVTAAWSGAPLRDRPALLIACRRCRP